MAVRAGAFEVVDASGRAVARLGPIPGSEVDEPGVGLVVLGPDGTARLTVGLDSTGPGIHLSHGGMVRCSVAVVDGDVVLVALRDRRGNEVASLVVADGSA